ncbi:MAG: 2-phosphosulfolactate phosphatase, partial [Candidatus Dormibacteraceae bacterium]
MRVEHTSGIDGAARANGVVVIIDVFRAFTVSAYALGEGATECWLVGKVTDALELQGRTPDSIISAEVDGLPVPGIAISNSPTQVLAAEVRGHSLIQRT